MTHDDSCCVVYFGGVIAAEGFRQGLYAIADNLKQITLVQYNS